MRIRIRDAHPFVHSFLRLPRPPHSLAQASEEKELACAYAALVLHDAGKPISAVSCLSWCLPFVWVCWVCFYV